MEKEQTPKKKNIKKKKVNKTNNKVVIIACILLVIVLVLCIVLNKNKLKGENLYSEFNHISSAIENYNKSKVNVLDRVILAEPEQDSDDILFIINGKLEAGLTKHISTVNYTDKRINIMIYDNDGILKEIVNATIDENYNITQVAVVDSKAPNLSIYTAEDKEFEEYQKMASVATQRIRDLLVTLNASDVKLFNKTLTELKNTKYSK